MIQDTLNNLTPTKLADLSVNTIRFLSVDAVQKANSGHPGLPLDAAPMAYVLWNRIMQYNPGNPNWFNRDRFVLSAGHGSMLLYSMLYLTGYDLPLEQIKQFRQWGSMTPGHPERNHTPGVETTTGPLGQGFANGVGMTIAEASLAARYNRPEYELINHYTYGIVSDGDLMEGISSEAASIAGHLHLGKLIYLYDNNHVTLSAGTDIAFTENVKERFDAFEWQTIRVEDGNDLDALEQAIRLAKADTQRPSLILVYTHLGYGSPNKQDTYEAHGSPLGIEEVKLTKENLGWPTEPDFYVPEPVLEHFREAVQRGKQAESEWNDLFERYQKEYTEVGKELRSVIDGKLEPNWDQDIPWFKPSDGQMATRVAIGKVMNASGKRLPALIGGDADLGPSTHTVLKGLGDFESPARNAPDRQGAAGGEWSYAGRNIHFGVREHAMGAIVNGMAVHGGTIPYGSTFLIFSDYMRPAIRLAALMNAQSIFIFTHDSIALGEDGPTHEPVEQLVSLRAIPGMNLLRPADANETAVAWRIAVESKDGPVALALTRQGLPIIDIEKYPNLKEGVRKGGYVLSDVPQGKQPQLTLVATGSEVHLALGAQEQLAKENIAARVVSLPSWNLFNEQPQDYQNQVVPPNVPILAIEAGSSLGWKPYLGPAIAVIGVNKFGASAPGEEVLANYGFTLENVVKHAREVINQYKEQP